MIKTYGKISKNVNDSLALNSSPPPAYQELKNLFEKIVERLNAESANDQGNHRWKTDFIEDFTLGFKSGTWSWRPITKMVADDEVDRLGEVIKGSIYTCQEYPWPDALGFPMAPLIQLDLRKASEIGGINLGDGLLQIWMPHEAISTPLFIRVVPRAFVEISKLTPTVPIPDEMYPLQARGEVWNDALEEFVPCQSFQLIGYEAGRFTCQIAHPIQDNYLIKELTTSAETQQLIKDFDKKLKPLIKKGLKGFRPNDCHLFGTFVRVQYAANEVPNPLFCFESDDLEFMWGEGGNAQLFYEIDGAGQVKFSFDWSSS